MLASYLFPTVNKALRCLRRQWTSPYVERPRRLGPCYWRTRFPRAGPEATGELRERFLVALARAASRTVRALYPLPVKNGGAAI